MKKFRKGRGAQINPANPFHNQSYDIDPLEHEDENPLKTQYIKVHPKTIVNKVPSPDIPYDFSMNPYQGCEHGCVYCYARNTHTFWGYSAGIDFEQKILIKESAPKLLEKVLSSPKWKASYIMLSGNTDCYQPIERELEITRNILKVFWKFRHPVGIITKNALILRDLDILKDLSSNNLVKVVLTITTLKESLRQILEPRTSTSQNRLNTLKQLSEAGIPVKVMMAPIIPSLNDDEIFSLAEKASEAGANSMYFSLTRLNGDVAQIFENWLDHHFPDRKEKILNKIRESHGGKLGDSRFGKRMSGEGNYAAIIHQQMALARKKYFSEKKDIQYNTSLHEYYKSNQLRLF